METMTCQLMWAGAKEAANYSPTCKYSWKMIVLIWTSTILIKYFDYFWDRLWDGRGEAVKGINLFIAENKVVFPGNSPFSCLWPTPMTPSITVCLPFVSPGSVPVLVPQDHDTPASSSRQKPKGEGWGKAGNQGGSCLRPEPPAAQPSVLTRFPVVPVSGKPRNSQLPAPTLGFPTASRYQHRMVPLGASCPEWVHSTPLTAAASPSSTASLGKQGSAPAFSTVMCTEHHSAMVGMETWANSLAAAGTGGRGNVELVHKTANQRSRNHLCKKTAEGFDGFKKQQDKMPLPVWHAPKRNMNSSDIAYGRQSLRTGGAVKPRKMCLAFQLVQDTKLSLGSAAGSLGLINVSERCWICREPGAVLQARQLRQRQAAAGTRPGCWWAKQTSQPGASFQASLRPHFKWAACYLSNNFTGGVELLSPAIFWVTLRTLFSSKINPSLQLNQRFVFNESSITGYDLGTVTCLHHCSIN